jgi:XTP/dITP diphosphohydrolase
MLHLKAVGDKSAKFRSCLVIYDPSGNESVIEGTLEGTIAKSASGTDGFGYDPIFIPKGETKTLAELGLAFKNRVSHRAQALMNWLEQNSNPK